MATTSISLSPPTFLCIFIPKPSHFLRTHRPPLPFTSPITLSFKRTNFVHHKSTEKGNPIRRMHATSGEALPSETIPLESSREIVSSSDDGATVISVLLFIAFIGLAILTVGIIYIAVTDFLQKRERDKFEKEESANKKKSGKKKVVRSKVGPRGFGQKIEEGDE